MIVLPDAVNRTIVSSFVWTQYRSVTEGRTDRQTDRSPLATECQSDLTELDAC